MEHHQELKYFIKQSKNNTRFFLTIKFYYYEKANSITHHGDNRRYICLWSNVTRISTTSFGWMYNGCDTYISRGTLYLFSVGKSYRWQLPMVGYKRCGLY